MEKGKAEIILKRYGLDYQLGISKIESAGKTLGAVLLAVDVTEKNNAERTRREFSANVSHELKTPIALIQGYAEGLYDNINDDSESRKFYCEVIMDEADKMNKMVKKLLTLNQIEFGNNQVNFEHFDIVQVVRTVINSATLLAKQKEAQIEMDDYPQIYVWADEYMIEEVVTNYVSNAINHVDGEKKIKVSLKKTDKVVRVSVFNTGKCIPEEELDKIWIKFYKVDKASLSETFCREVYQVVCEIPLGKVSTYGSIAALLGMPQCSRMVGRALKQVPDNVSTPCHRVVNASGRLVPGWEEQKQILLEEGVSFKQNGCVDLKKHLWNYSVSE